MTRGGKHSVGRESSKWVGLWAVGWERTALCDLNSDQADLGARARQPRERQNGWEEKRLGHSSPADEVFLPRWGSRTREWRDRIWKDEVLILSSSFCSAIDLTVWLNNRRFLSGFQFLYLRSKEVVQGDFSVLTWGCCFQCEQIHSRVIGLERPCSILLHFRRTHTETLLENTFSYKIIISRSFPALCIPPCCQNSDVANTV